MTLIKILTILQSLLAVLIILYLTPQTPKDNVMVKYMYETGWFTGFKEVKSVLQITNWVLVSLFLLITFLLNLV
jgi:preprotein translocase subunit SecG